MAALVIPTAEVFEPLLEPARYKGAHGGRGSGKSHFFAGLGIDDALRAPSEIGEGLRLVCIREYQKSLKGSVKQLIADKLKQYRLGPRDGFQIFDKVIQTPGDGIIDFQGMQDHTAESIKSLEGYHRAWIEEAQTLSRRSLMLLRPTIRAPGSEIWASWNARRRTDAIDMMLRGKQLPTGAVVVQANWQHNPWFTKELEQERLDCLRDDPEQYPHIWDGEYAVVLEGAYFARQLADVIKEKRVTFIAPDPLMTIRAFCDIGGTGARADSFVIVIAQFVGKAIHVLDYYEAQGQPIGAHLQWLRERKYTGETTQIWLPHDGETQDRVHDASYEGAFKQAGYKVTVVPNQGKGAAAMRIAAGRRHLNKTWFNSTPEVDSFREALGWYHEKRDPARTIGLGPEHDWSSHGSDAGGLMWICYEEPSTNKRVKKDSTPRRGHRRGGGWETR